MVNLRRPHRSSQASWSLYDTSSLDTMSIAHSEASTSSSSRARARDTGFPASFCGKNNTSLPHPDADTSPNASISQDDVSPSRTVSRHRHSLLARSKRTISHGYITPEMQRNYSEMALSESGASPTGTRGTRLPGNPTRPLSGGATSFNSASTGNQEDAAPKSPERQPTRKSSIGSIRKNFMGKLGYHR